MFPHLHVHSHFSLGAGASSPAVLVEAARQRGIPALACTDTNGVYGAVEFQQEAERAGVRPVLGAHLVAGGQEAVVLAEDERGWAALCRAITGIHWHRRHAKAHPFALSAQLATDRAGLAVLTRDVDLLERLVQLSGPEGLYAELVPSRQRHQVLATARRLGVPPVVSNAVMFAHPEGWARHRLLVAIAQNRTLSTVPAELVAPRDAWLKPEAELARHFPDCPEAMDHAVALADRCRYRIPIGRIIPPRLAAAEDAFARLRALAYEGATRKYGTVAPMVRDRLEHELAIIAAKQFADYFLVVRDIVLHGPTHCGRGSVANSVVSYCLGITHVEPLGAGLLFERFLNPERKDPPDIDLDFPWDERDNVLAYVFRRYPMPRAAMVANHNTFKLRGALREVAKVHGRPAGEIREVTRRIPWYSDDVPIGELLATHPNYQGLNLPAYWQELATTATPLVGTPRHLSLHPGGVVIVPGALTDYVPIEPAVKELTDAPDLVVPVIQFEKDGAEDAGLVKIDLLGNRSLAVIRDGIAAVAASTGRQLDYTSQEAGEDPATRALFRTGGRWGCSTPRAPPAGRSASRARRRASSCWCSTPASSGRPRTSGSRSIWSGCTAATTSRWIPACAMSSAKPSG
jgi:error-prone DNA polymerase